MSGESREPSGERMHLDSYVRKYGMDEVDGFVGPDSAQYVHDWGPPVVLADSAVTYELNRLRYPEIYRKSFLGRLSERLFGKSPAQLQAEAILARQAPETKPQ